MARKLGNRSESECANKFFEQAEAAERALEALEAKRMKPPPPRAPRLSLSSVDGSADRQSKGASAQSSTDPLRQASPWLNSSLWGGRDSFCGDESDDFGRRDSFGVGICGGGGGGLLRNLGKTKRAQIGMYIRGSKAKKLLDGGAQAVSRRRELHEKALERERGRAAAAGQADGAPFMAMFSTPQVEDEDEVGVGNDLKDDSESEDDYYFD